MMKKTIGPVLALLALLALPSAASAASIVFTFNNSGCCGTGPFGTVTITDIAANQVDVLVQLNAGIGFVDTGSGNHPDFAFNLHASIGALTPGDITLLNDGVGGSGAPNPWNWALHGSAVTSDGLGLFQYTYLCNDPAPPGTQRCGNGGSNPNPGPLQFLITKPGLSTASFVGNLNGHYFVADIINGQAGGNGQTGLVWANLPGTPDQQCTFNCDPSVPEPASLLLLGTGLAALAVRLRRRRA